MEKNVSKALDNFIGVSDEEKTETVHLKDTVNAKKVILDEREGLIERVDRIYVTKDGKQLLREQY
jgi:hypothetical protein